MSKFKGDRAMQLDILSDALWDMQVRVMLSKRDRGHCMNLYLGSEEFYDFHTLAQFASNEVYQHPDNSVTYHVFGIPCTVYRVEARNHFNFARQ